MAAAAVTIGRAAASRWSRSGSPESAEPPPPGNKHPTDELLVTIDAGNPVTWSGRFRPALTDAVILPRPYPKPGLGEHLRISVATGGNPESSVRAGVLGLPIKYAIIGGQPARFAPLVDLTGGRSRRPTAPARPPRRWACPGWVSSPMTATR